jgi:[acyl-carrier-protein] S-malonyltransferase
MRPAAEKLRERLASMTLQQPSIAVVNNVDVQMEFDAEKVKDALYRQAFGPVRWVESIRLMRSQGVTAVVECGPGKVLTGLSKRIAPEIEAVALMDPSTLQDLKNNW